MIGPLSAPGRPHVLPAGAREERPLCRGPHPPFHRCHPHGAAAGGGHPQGQADRRHRRVRLRQDHADSGKPGARACRRSTAGRPLPSHVKAVTRRGHRAGQAHRCHAHRHQRAVHCGYLRQRPRRTAQDLCPHSGRQGRTATRQAISPTTRANCAARCATAPASSAWTCSSCRMWTSPAPLATVPAMPARPTT